MTRQQVSAMFDRSLQHGRRGYDLVSRFVAWVLRILDQLLDVAYDRLDLWQNKERKIASFKKIRSMALYGTVLGVVVYVVQNSFGKPPVGFLTTILLALLAASFGENVLMAFFEVLARRWGPHPLGAPPQVSGPTPPPGETP